MRPIVQLDPQLANQIAAGEVVERPASVVKELVENSLDAGADRVDIEILAGGSQLIRIRDNGSGIPKAQLPLALAPHATSKIASLIDLEDLHSFGFRGEALASISSVSKFSITSKTTEQEQGWSATTKGSAMDVLISPAPSTVGTRIDVAELFYNTPARRRFLRTEKTEFYQIETVVKQAVLANPSVTFSLKHNQRLSRRFAAAQTAKQEESRIASILGKEFVENAVHIDVSHNELSLSGWIGMPSYHRSQTDGQYFYVNQRPVKDKVLMHALRQAYLPLIPEGRAPAYVLFLNMDARAVDVNVHPTKHEVRFHAVRTVHDFIVQAIEQCIHEGIDLIDKEIRSRVSQDESVSHSLKTNYSQAAINPKAYDSYQNFIAGAYRNNLNDVERSQQRSSQLDVDNGHILACIDQSELLIFRSQSLQLITIKALFESLQKLLESEQESLVFPEIIDLPDKNERNRFCDWLTTHNIQSEEMNEQVKILRLPKHLKVRHLSELLISWFKYSTNNLETLLLGQWRWLLKPEPELAKHITLISVPLEKLPELFKQYDEK